MDDPNDTKASDVTTAAADRTENGEKQLHNTCVYFSYQIYFLCPKMIDPFILFFPSYKQNVSRTILLAFFLPLVALYSFPIPISSL